MKNEDKDSVRFRISGKNILHTDYDSLIMGNEKLNFRRIPNIFEGNKRETEAIEKFHGKEIKHMQ